MAVLRVFVEKKDEFAIEARQLLLNIKQILKIETISKVRIFNRYDVEGIGEQLFLKSIPIIFSESLVDETYSNFPTTENVLAIEFLPNQFCQREFACEQAIKLLDCSSSPIVKTAKIYSFIGNISNSDLIKIKQFLINPIECREASLEKPTTLKIETKTNNKIEIIENFNILDLNELTNLINKNNLSLSLEDLKLCQDYFKSIEKRKIWCHEQQKIEYILLHDV